jgi:hypothetical protein
MRSFGKMAIDGKENYEMPTPFLNEQYVKKNCDLAITSFLLPPPLTLNLSHQTSRISKFGSLATPPLQTPSCTSFRSTYTCSLQAGHLYDSSSPQFSVELVTGCCWPRGHCKKSPVGSSVKASRRPSAEYDSSAASVQESSAASSMKPFKMSSGSASSKSLDLFVSVSSSKDGLRDLLSCAIG